MANQQLLQDWLNGTVTGGPNGDGRYPLIGADGETYLIPCPAAYAADPSLDPSELAVFTDAATEAAALAGASATEAATSESNAAVSATNAANSATAALASENAAESSASAAATSASNALSYRNTASTHATNAGNSATAAQTARTGAETARTGAETARDKAQAWADNNEDVAVETGKFSAKHWAAKAAAAVTGYVTSLRKVNAGNGLTGGGDLSADRTLTLGTPGTLTGATTNTVTSTSHTHALSANLSAWDGLAPSAKVNAAGPTFTSGYFSIYPYSSSHVGTLNGRLESYVSETNANAPVWKMYYKDSANTPLPLNLELSNGANYYVGVNAVWHAGTFNPADYAPTTRNFAAGNGLTGGGTLAANRTITLGTPGTITNATTNAVTTTSHTHALTLSASDLVSILGYNVVQQGTGVGQSNNAVKIGWNGSKLLATVDSSDQGAFVFEDRTITAGNGLNGGGSLATNRTIALGTPGTITNSTTNSVSSTSHTHALTVTKADVGLGNVENYTLSTWNSTHVTDDRGAARAPNYYARRTVSTTFHDGTSISGDPGGDTYTVALTVAPWTSFNTTHRQQQLAFCGTGGLKFRYSTSDTAWGGWQNVAMGDVAQGANASTIAERNGSGDLYARLFRSTYGDQATIGGAIAFRVNAASDNYIRFCSDTSAIRSWLSVSSDSNPVFYNTLLVNNPGSLTSGYVQLSSPGGNPGVIGNFQNTHRSDIQFRAGKVFIGASSGTGAPTIGMAIDSNGTFEASGRIFTGYDSGVAGSISCSQFFRSTGNTGWYNSTHGTGVYSTSTTYLRSYGDKPVYANDFVTPSDIRLKSDIEDLVYKGRLRPVEYTLDKTGERQIGFIAQEVEKEYPILIGEETEEDGTVYKNLSYNKVAVILSAQINQLEDTVAKQAAIIEAMEARLTALEGK